MKITIYNEFHNTEAAVQVTTLPATLSPSQVRRVRRKLCGIEGCTCGGDLSERGGQDVFIEALGPEEPIRLSGQIDNR